jgi:type I restriction enzyme, S subunit
MKEEQNKNGFVEGWKILNFGEIIHFLTDYQANGSFAGLKENVRYYSEKSFAVLVRLKDLRHELKNSDGFVYTDEKGYNFLKKSRVKEGDILVANVGAGVGTTLKMPKLEGYATLGPNMFRVDLKECVLPKFFLAFTNSMNYWHQLNLVSAGSGQPKINKAQYRSIKVPIPPLDVQQQIVFKIEELFSELDKGIEELKTAQQQLKVYRQAVLKWAFEGKLTEEWREAQLALPSPDVLYEQIIHRRSKNYNEKFTDFKNGKIAKSKRPFNLDPKNELQEDIINEKDVTNKWKIVPLVFISANEPDAIVDGPFGSSINVNQDYIESGVPVIRMVNIRPLRFIKEEMKFIKEIKFHELQRHNILPGDVLIAKVGATIGDCCIYPIDEPEAMLSTTGSCRIRVDQSMMSNKFLQYYIFFQKNTLKKIASQTAQPFLNMKVLKSFPIVLPTIEEQQQIVQEIESRLSVCDKIEETITNSLKQSEALRQSILKNAFDGKLIQ